ncbi:MAG: WecB/TagA/CpsF family glycosyltransferase [Caulobacterales bacterium]|nr:WecB/TagA/CpsF family glycosyltransferase [Caulobacterales bacterium]
MTQITLMDDNSLLLDRRDNARNVDFLGVVFTPLNANQLLERVIQKANSDEKFGFLITPNVDHFARLSKDNSHKHIYENSWMNVSDSRILELFAKFSGFDLPACPGSDLTASLMNNAIKSGDDITLIGGDAEIVEFLQNKYGVKVHWHEPPMGLKNKPDALDEAGKFIANSPAKYHFVCVGSPQQELVCEAAMKYENAKGIGLCVGASMDFLAGRAKRAPQIMQQLRLEWLYRLLSEPKRLWKRYLIDGPRIFSVWLKWRKEK